MSPIAIAGLLLIILPASLLLYRVIAADSGTRKLVRQNLIHGPIPTSTKKSQAPTQDLEEFVKRLAPKSYSNWLKKLLNRAGRPVGLPIQRLLVLKPLLALTVFFVGFLAIMSNSSRNVILLTVLATVLAYFTPDILLDSRAKDRKSEIDLALPNTLDQVLISVQAGLGFESAMTKAAISGKGPLSEELRRTLQDIQMGRNRAESYLDLADRTDVKDLRSFVRAIIQADKYGISIANVLRTQADELRIKRRQRAEEKAMKLPVKILFPLIFTILPVLFIVILSPLVLDIGKMFGGGGF